MIELAKAHFGACVELLYVEAKLEFVQQHTANSALLFSEVFSRLEPQVFIHDKPDISAYFLPNLERLSDAVTEVNIMGGSGWRERAYRKSEENNVRKIDKRINKVIVTSVPKAGTHLVSKLLSDLNVPSSHLFMEPKAAVLELDNSFGSNRVYMYRNLDGFPESFVNRLPIDVHTTLSLLRDNEHVMCHLPPVSIPAEWLEKVKVLAVFRSPRRTIESEFLTELRLFSEQTPYNYDPELEYILGSGLAQGEVFVAWLKRYLPERRDFYEDMLGWKDCSSAFCFCYENLVSSSGEGLIGKIAEYLNVDLDQRSLNLRGKLINSDTPTKNKDYSAVRNSLWSDEALAIYHDSGFEQIEDEIAKLCAVNRV